MIKKNKKNETPSGDNTEQYIKDVRKVDSLDELVQELKQAPDEIVKNEEAQEHNKKSQKDAELDAPFGDSSDPQKSKLNNKK